MTVTATVPENPLTELEALTERLTRYTPGLVLIIDDDAMMRRTLRDILRKDGWGCLDAETGEDGIDMVGEYYPAVVLIDLRLPGMQGLEVARRIAEISPASWRVVITGYATVETAIEAVRLGMHGFLMKPVVIDELLSTLARRKPDGRQQAEQRSRERVGHLG